MINNKLTWISENPKKRLQPPLSLEHPSKKTTADNIHSESNNNGTFCTECNHDFSKPFALRRHQRSVHQMHERYICSSGECGKTFTRRDTRDRHVETMHGSAKPLCPSCGIPVRKDGLSEHMATRLCQVRKVEAEMRSQTSRDEDHRLVIEAPDSADPMDAFTEY